VPPPGRDQRRPPVGDGAFGRRDGNADLAPGASLCRHGVAAAGRALGEPGAALRRPLRERRRLHQRPRRTARRPDRPCRDCACVLYTLSLHSGSDKFSVYPLAVDATGGMVHLKTAGTSMLTAQQAIAMADPALFRQLYALAFERFATDRASYHISAEPARAPRLDGLLDADLPAVVDQFDARQMLHVTFGSAIMQYGPAMQAALRAHEEIHYAALERHFNRHLAPFARTTS